MPPGQAERPRRDATERSRRIIRLLLVAIFSVVGCHQSTTQFSEELQADGKSFVLNEIDVDAGKTILSQLGFPHVGVSTEDPNTLLVRASVDGLTRIATVLTLVDSRQGYIVQTLAPLSAARHLPTNRQIAEVLDGLAIGTFEEPPGVDGKPGAIIDIHREAVVAILPSRFQGRLTALVGLRPEAGERRIDTCKSPPEGFAVVTTVAPERARADVGEGGSLLPVAACSDIEMVTNRPGPGAEEVGAFAVFALPRLPPEEESPSVGRAATEAQPAQMPAAVEPELQSRTLGTPAAGLSLRAGDQEMQAVTEPIRTEITVPRPPVAGPQHAIVDYKDPVAPVDNGKDTLVLNLPEQLDVVLLLDLAAEYLHLDYIYDPAKMRGQTVTLKLRGKFQGEITVGELYPLLESVLRFRGYAMTRGEGNLVTIVPVDDVLTADPELIGPEGGVIRPGDMTVTRVLQLRHIDATSAKNLLENMSLGVAVSPIAESRTLIVTCYASRLSRIERLLEMIDRPGRPKKVLFRQLQYISASMLAEKVGTLAPELQTLGVTVSLTPRARRPSSMGSPPPPVPLPETNLSGGNKPSTGESVHLDADERTNRIVMVGYEEPVGVVAQLVDAFDVPGLELRTPEIYPIAHVEARTVKEKLKELGFIDRAAATQKPAVATPPAKPSPAGEREQTVSPGGGLVEEPDIIALEATNALLATATREQHARLAELLERIDRAPQDSRVLRTYRLMHIEAQEARDKLAELRLCSSPNDLSLAGGMPQKGPSRETVNAPDALPSPAPEAAGAPAVQFGEPHVVVMEPTNSLLVSALPGQHAQIEVVLRHLDSEMLEDDIPYKVYPLANSSPSHLATVLESLIRRTVPGDDAKISKVIKREQEMAIVPDPNTYALIVYASKKNQDWIASLIKQLDQRRPQVLIDVTLVEITEMDAFTYDLHLLRSSPDLDSTASITGIAVDPSAMGRFAQADGGLFRAFYGDEHVRALLRAIQSKNYGRILAKPKILVNDNEPGTIKTADRTYVQVTSSIPVSTGGAGTDVTLIQTAVRYEPYEAGITLNITPHIGQGEILRLEVKLVRSDFRQGTFADRPPDTTSSELTTSVFVPDGGTIILGGLLKMNQMKGTTKVPILGDIPVVGGLFRSIDNTDTQSKLYIFLKAEIIRPIETDRDGLRDLGIVSERDRAAFEKHEQEFQSYEQWPGIKGRPKEPVRVLEAR